jgi:hypothetical protein
LTELLNVAMVGHSDFRRECKTCTSQYESMTFFMLIDIKQLTTPQHTTFAKIQKYEHSRQMNVIIRAVFN